MKKRIAVAVCLVGLLAFTADSVQAREVTVKIGGGVYFDETLGGGNAQVDIPVAAEGQFNIAPFVDAYVTKSWFKVAGGGINLMFKKEVNESGKFFIGAGGGFGHVRLSGLTGNGGMANFLVGGEFPVSEKISIFGQGRWLGFFAGTERVTTGTGLGAITRTFDLEPRNFAIELGIAFNVGE